MPRPLVLLLLVLLAVAGAAPRTAAEEEYPRRFGKSEKQILAMGLERWMEYQGGKAGQSTAAMNEGMAAYRQALRSRNDRLARKATSRLRNQVAALRPLLERFTQSTVEIGSFITGGGTLWSLVHSDALVDAETTLYGLLGGRIPPAKRHTTGEVQRALNALEPDIAAAAREMPARSEEHLAALKALARARSEFRAIAAVAAGMDRSRSDRVLGFCLERIEAAEEADEEASRRRPPAVTPESRRGRGAAG